MLKAKAKHSEVDTNDFKAIITRVESIKLRKAEASGVITRTRGSLIY